jgi:hypothetical protein
MNRKATKIVAVVVLASLVTLMGCQTLGIKKIPPGQQKKEQHDNRGGKKK